MLQPLAEAELLAEVVLGYFQVEVVLGYFQVEVVIIITFNDLQKASTR